MKYQFKGFHQVAPVKQSMSGDGSFIYTVVYFIHNTEDNSVFSEMAEIAVPGSTTNADTNPFILQNVNMRINAMWNKVK
jgi:hypothetical protein